MLGGVVANRSTTSFEPHSKEESLLRALVAVPGLGGLGGVGENPAVLVVLEYDMHDGLGCITGLSIYFLLVIIWSDVSEACYSFVDHYY